MMVNLVAHLAVIFAGFTALAMAFITGDWRFLSVTVFAYFITVKT